MRSDSTGPQPVACADLLTRVLQELDAGGEPDAATLALEFPESESEIRQLIAVVRLVRGAGPPPAGAAILDARPAGIAPSAIVGAYRLVREIGRGGMGIVYEAEQTSLSRRVAIKFLLPGVSPQGLERFSREAETAGGLAHPHIVPVYEIGDYDGAPYYTLRLIDGPPLSQIIAELRAARASPAASHYSTAAEWIRQAAEALAFAHTHGVIHRDVKPSNILIESGRHAWVTDFGLARRQAAATLTMSSDVIGTVRYMSPEQARGGSLLDARTDVYSLGATLYELVALRPAFHAADHASTLRQVLMDEPPSPRAVNARVPVALQAIVMRAMEKNPERRYRSAAEMAQDLGAFLRGAPTLARLPSLSHRVARLARRYRAPLALTGALFTLLAAFGVWMGALYARAHVLAEDARRNQVAAAAARDAETASRLAAEAAAARAQSVQDFLQQVLSSVDPQVAQMRDTTLLADMLRRASARVDAELGAETDVAAAVHATVGMTLKAMGRYDEAEPHLRIAMDTQRALLGEAHEASWLSRMNWTDLAHDRGDLDRAERLAAELVESSERLYGAQHDHTLAARLALSEVLGDLGRLDEAEALCREVLKVAPRSAGARSYNAVAALNNLATLLQQQRRYEEAESLLREALAMNVERLGPQHRDTLMIQSNLASVLNRMGRSDEAERGMRETLAVRERLLGSDHPDTLVSLNNYAQLLRRAGRIDESEPLLRRAWAGFRRNLGDEHPFTLVTLYNVIGLSLELGRLDSLDSLTPDLMDFCAAVYGEWHAETADSLTLAGQCLMELGELDRARDALERAWVGAATSGDAALLAGAELRLGACLLAQGEQSAARTRLESAYDELCASLGADHPDVLECERLIARLPAESSDKPAPAASRPPPAE